MLPLPRVVLVLGKGGAGRSTVSAALGLELAARGERVLVFEWTVAEPIAPWFGRPPAGVGPVEIAPRLSVATYALEEALRAYFVDHLHLGLVHRHVVSGRHVRKLVEAAPGLAELLFLGTLWWLTTLAEKEAGLAFDRIVVDAPATGHGASLLDFPATLAPLGAGGLLGLEVSRVTGMMRDPAWTGALVVSLPEELSVEETLELVPRATKAMGRAPLAAIVNRSVAKVASAEARPSWLARLGASLSPESRAAVEMLHGELRGRARREGELRRALEGATMHGTFAVDDRLVVAGDRRPRDVVAATALALRPLLEGAP